jgi:hypothetical protein
VEKENTTTSKEDQTETDDDFDEFAALVGTKKPTLTDKIQILSQRIIGKSRKLKAGWSIDSGGFPAPPKLIKKLRERYGRHGPK